MFKISSRYSFVYGICGSLYELYYLSILYNVIALFQIY